jgi:hypothetical protein
MQSASATDVRDGFAPNPGREFQRPVQVFILGGNSQEFGRKIPPPGTIESVVEKELEPKRGFQWDCLKTVRKDPHFRLEINFEIRSTASISPRMCRIVGFFQSLRAYVGINLCRRQIRMTEKRLKTSEVGTIVQQMGCEAVSELVRRKGRRESGKCQVFFHLLFDRVCG